MNLKLLITLSLLLVVLGKQNSWSQIQYNNDGTAMINGTVTNEYGSPPPNQQSSLANIVLTDVPSSQNETLDLGEVNEGFGGVPEGDYSATGSFGGSYTSSSLVFNTSFSDSYTSLPAGTQPNDAAFEVGYSTTLSFTLQSEAEVSLTGNQTGGIASAGSYNFVQDNADGSSNLLFTSNTGVVPRNFNDQYSTELDAGTYSLSFQAGNASPGEAGDRASAQLTVTQVTSSAPEPPALVLMMAGSLAFLALYARITKTASQ